MSKTYQKSMEHISTPSPTECYIKEPPTYIYIYIYIYLYLYIHMYIMCCIPSRGLLEMASLELGVELAMQYVAQYCRQHVKPLLYSVEYCRQCHTPYFLHLCIYVCVRHMETNCISQLHAILNCHNCPTL